METFSALLAICVGNSPVPGEFPTQRPVTRSFDVFFDLRLNNGSVNNREAGDLRRYHAHYDVTVMLSKGDSNLRGEQPGIEQYSAKTQGFVPSIFFIFLMSDKDIVL